MNSAGPTGCGNCMGCGDFMLRPPFELRRPYGLPRPHGLWRPHGLRMSFGDCGSGAATSLAPSIPSSDPAGGGGSSRLRRPHGLPTWAQAGPGDPKRCDDPTDARGCGDCKPLHGFQWAAPAPCAAAATWTVAIAWAAWAASTPWDPTPPIACGHATSCNDPMECCDSSRLWGPRGVQPWAPATPASGRGDPMGCMAAAFAGNRTLAVSPDGRGTMILRLPVPTGAPERCPSGGRAGLKRRSRGARTRLRARLLRKCCSLVVLTQRSVARHSTSAVRICECVGAHP